MNPVLLLLQPLLAALTLGSGGPLARELGPAPNSWSYTGRVSAIATSRTNANLYYVGGADGGVWKTVDGGVTFTALTESLPSLAIGAIAIDPTDEKVLYAGSGEANFANHSRYGFGLYKSTDGGSTWSILGRKEFAGRCFSRIVVDPTAPNRLYAAITRAGGFPEMAAAKGHPRATGPVGVFRSLDGGLTWQHLKSGLPALSATDLCMDPQTPATLFAAIGHIFGNSLNGIYKTTDGGSTWIKLTSGLPSSDVGRISLDIATTNPSRLYALFTEAASSSGGSAYTIGAYRTDNGGSSWTALPDDVYQSSYGWYLSVVRVHPTDANIVFMGGLDLHRSRNSGSSWSTLYLPHVDLHALQFDASARLIAGDDGGVHRSSNLGDSWSALNQGLGLVQFYAGVSIDPRTDVPVLAGAQDNGTHLRTSDSRSAWDVVLGGDGGFTQIDPLDPRRKFAEFQGTGNLYVSAGGGFSWSGSGINSSDRNCFLPPYLIVPGDSMRMYYGTHRLYRSLNGGASWTSITGDLTKGSGAIRSLAVGTTDPNVIYLSTNDGIVLVSTNGAGSFRTIFSDHPGWPRVTRELFVDPLDAQSLYLATASFGADQVRRSRDAGLTFETLDGDLPDVPVNVIVADTRDFPVIYAGTDCGLFRSEDNGHSWRRYGQGLPHAAVIDLLLDPLRHRLIVATQGRGSWEVPHVLTASKTPRSLR